jgi:Domain of unknown function (DUF6798)
MNFRQSSREGIRERTRPGPPIMSKPDTISRLRAAAAFLFWACVFAAVYCQAPLYYSNQNQYFLHGLADAGVGFVRDDWLANTIDPTPLFSLLVAATVRYLAPAAFYAYYVLIFGVYAASMVGLFSYLAGDRDTPRLRVGFLALFLAIHSAVARLASYRLVGVDYPWYFQAGVAGQYVLGAMFQPSTFGVLLVLSACLFVRGRPYWAVVSACLAAAMHSTYAIGAGMLTAGYLVALIIDNRYRQAALLGAWALALIAPVLGYVLFTFGPTSASTFAEAQHILVHLRIPHHCLPRLWCDWIAAAQICWCLLGLWVARGTRLFPVLSVAFLLGLALTLLQVASGSDAVALTFPWRISSVLVPIATTVILARLVVGGAPWFDRPRVAFAGGAVVVALVLGGLAITCFHLGFQAGDAELPLMDWVKANKAKGDLYLIPVTIPKLSRTTKGSHSSDFEPVEDKKGDSGLIPVNLQRFRLYAEVPIFVDFKSIPYKDTEVLEWQQRLHINRQLYESLRSGDPADLRRPGITHVVVPADQTLQGAPLQRVYEDLLYRVYRLPEEPAPSPRPLQQREQ